MSFNTALSGLNAAQSELSITSNNIANVATVGFKQSRAEFGDIFARTSIGSNSTAIGSGVLLSKVAQQFNQGNLEFTANSLDLALAGEGFFVLSPNLTSDERIYSRAGQFGVDEDGYVVNPIGQVLQVFAVDENEEVTNTSITSTVDLQLPQAIGTPTPTSVIELGINFPADSTPLDPLLFDPTNANTYTASTSVTIFDSLGESHLVSTHYLKTIGPPDNTWAQYASVDGAAIDVSGGTAGAGGQLYGTLTFSNSGVFISEAPTPMDTVPFNFTNGSDVTQFVTLDYANNIPTQFASPFTVNSLSQDGFATGRLSGASISDDGVVRANFTNGQQIALGKIALARFTNPQGLEQLGNVAWRETQDSGIALPGESNTGVFGLIRSGALESSNADLTSELVNLITAQRNFQANARSIETSNAVTQTIIQIR